MNFETEKLVLSGVLTHKSVHRLFFSYVKNDAWFSLPAHKSIVNAMIEIRNNQDSVDISTVFMAIKNKEEYKDFDFSLVHKIASSYIAESAFETQLKILNEHYIRRELAKEASKIQSLIEGETSEYSSTGRELAVNAINTIGNILQDTSIVRETEVKDVMMSILKDLEDKETKRTTECGIPSIDRLHGGLPKGGKLITLAARPAMGKTTIALTMLKHISANGIPCAYFSFEMPTSELLTKLVVADVGRNDFTNHRINTKDYDFAELSVPVTNAMSRIQKQPLSIIDKAGMYVEDMIFKIHELVETKKVQVVFIDHIGLLNVRKRVGTRTEHISHITGSLKVCAMELGIDIIQLSQLNRGVEQRPNKRPLMSDLRDSGSIEQDSDMVMFLYRDDYYAGHDNPDYVPTGEIEIDVAKNRAGKTGNNLSSMTYIHLPTNRVSGMPFSDDKNPYEKPKDVPPPQIMPSNLDGFNNEQNNNFSFNKDIPF